MALVRAPLASITECPIDEELVSTLQEPHPDKHQSTLSKNPNNILNGKREQMKIMPRQILSLAKERSKVQGMNCDAQAEGGGCMSMTMMRMP
eukprot:scaffold10595_cov238-Chaetoceros_neogracile.AAC.1